jgi:outer membrane lipoprotein SlyB
VAASTKDWGSVLQRVKGAAGGACAGEELETIMAETGSPAPVELLLKSKDGEIFKVEKSIAMQINFVKGMLEG